MGYYSVWKKDTSKQALYTCIVESVADNFKAVKGNGKAIPRAVCIAASATSSLERPTFNAEIANLLKGREGLLT